MKVVVDYDLCEANALCMDCCPEVFRVEEDDTLTVLIEDDVPGEPCARRSKRPFACARGRPSLPRSRSRSLRRVN